MFLRVPKRSLLKVTKSSFPRNGNQWYPYHLNVMCWSVPKRSLLKVTKSSFPCSGSQWYPYRLNFMCLRVAKRSFLRVAKRTPDQEPPLRPRNGRGSTPTPATWLRTISLGPTHEQPTCTRPTPTRRTNIIMKGWQQGAANACHTTIQGELHSCLDPASQAVLESESGPHARKPFTTTQTPPTSVTLSESCSSAAFGSLSP